MAPPVSSEYDSDEEEEEEQTAGASETEDRDPRTRLLSRQESERDKLESGTESGTERTARSATERTEKG